jgi:hypothetical protein
MKHAIVDRVGIHQEPTRFVLRFSDTLDPSSASNVARYKLCVVFRNGHVSPRPILHGPAVYDPSADMVKLWPAHQLNIHFHYQLTVSGVIDSHGNPLDGDANGTPGVDFVMVNTKSNYHRPIPAGPGAQMQRAAAWASRFPKPATNRDGSA